MSRTRARLDVVSWIAASLSLAHLVLFIPPKLIEIASIPDISPFVSLTAAPLFFIGFRRRRNNRPLFALGIIPVVAALSVYDGVFIKLSRSSLDQHRAQCEVELSEKGRSLVFRGPGGPQSPYCVEDQTIEGALPLTLCAPHPWEKQEVSLGDEFGSVTLWHSFFDDTPIVVSRIRVHPDHAPFAPAIVQLRRFSGLFRHRRGSIILSMESLPSLFSGATIGFHQQAAVYDLLLPHHFFQSVIGSRPITLLGRGVRLVEKE